MVFEQPMRSIASDNADDAMMLFLMRPVRQMMVMLMKDGRTEECLAYWRQLVCINGLNGVAIRPETYNFAIKCTSTVSNLDEMEAVLAMMEVCVCVATARVYI